MQQDKIWDYYQNSDLADIFFPEARQRYLMRYIKTGQNVLNIGIGSGAFERLALEKGVDDIYSLDPSINAIQRLKNSLGLGDRAKVGYAQCIPFDSDYFDVVVMSEVLEHLNNEDINKSVQEVYRILKHGGKFLVTTPYSENLNNNQVVCPKCGNVFHKVGHVQSFDKAKMCALLESNGFIVSKMWLDTFVDWRRKGLKNMLKTVIRVFLARIGERIADPHLIVIARK